MGGKTPSTTTQTTKVELSPEQKQLFSTAFPYAQQYAETPIQQYSGSGIAGFTPEQQAAQQQLLQAGQTAGNLTGQSAQTQALLLDPNFQLNNPHLQSQAQSIAQQLTQNLMENQLPGIRTGSTVAGGQYSGGATRQGIAEGKAIVDTNRAISNSVTDLVFRAYQQGLGNLQGAVQGTGEVAGQQTLGPLIQSAVGEQQQAMEQARLNELISQFYTGQALPLLQAQELFGLLSGMPGGQTTSTATGSVPSANPVSAGLGGALTGASLLPGMPLVGGAGGPLAALLLNR